MRQPLLGRPRQIDAVHREFESTGREIAREPHDPTGVASVASSAVLSTSTDTRLAIERGASRLVTKGSAGITPALCDRGRIGEAFASCSEAISRASQ